MEEIIEWIGEELVKEAMTRLQQKIDEITKTVKEEYIPLMSDFKKNLTGEMKGIAMGEIVDNLDLATLKGICKKYSHKVPGSNQVVATRVTEEDGIFVYLAYARDRELIQSPQIIVIIKAKTIDESVSALFIDSELIILK